jgi:hypothetical protein
MSVVIHQFSKSLEKSQGYVAEHWWEQIYRKAFPNFATMAAVTKDGWAQRGGIDRVITLTSGRTINVEEKVREREWPDVLLERWSDGARKRPGWVQKDLAAEYLAYVFLPSKTCLLFPFLDLRRAWREHGRRWIAECQEVRAMNCGYETVSVAVPVKELLNVLQANMRVAWE